MQSMAYLCRDMDRFSQGLCLSCKKGRCNTLGYHTRQERQSKKSKSLFLVTRAQSPFKGECRGAFRRAECSRLSEGSRVPWSLFLELLPDLLFAQIPDRDDDTCLSFPKNVASSLTSAGGESLILSETLLWLAALFIYFHGPLALLQEGGSLPGPENGLFSNTQK